MFVHIRWYFDKRLRPADTAIVYVQPCISWPHFLIALMSSETELAWATSGRSDVCLVSLVYTLILAICFICLASDSFCRFWLLTWVSQFVEIPKQYQVIFVSQDTFEFSQKKYLWAQASDSDALHSKNFIKDFPSILSDLWNPLCPFLKCRIFTFLTITSFNFLQIEVFAKYTFTI